MQTTTFHQTVTLDGSPRMVFTMLTDTARHSEFTGARSVIDAKVDGSFSYFDGAITGTFREVVRDERLVQTLRAGSWPEGHRATVTTELRPRGDGARTDVRVLETGIPVEEIEAVQAGWRQYWDGLYQTLRARKIEVVDRFVEEYKNRHNWDIVDELVAEDCKVHIPLPGLPQGREGMRINGRMVCGAFPDVRVVREFLATEGDLVIERAHAKATHRGPLLGMAPTGKPVTWSELHAYRVVDGMITEVWSEPDLLGMLVQLGVVQLPAG